MTEPRMTRRDFFKTSAWATALFAASPFWATDLDEPMPIDYMTPVPANSPIEWTTPADLADTDPAVLALNRIAFGPRPGDVERVRAMGVDAFIQEQLAPETIDDAAVTEMLKPFPSLEMEIPDLARYYVLPFGKMMAPQENDAASAVKGFLGLFSENNSMNPAMNPGMDNPNAMLAENRVESVLELIQATVLRQVYSERQLFEVMVDFWSDHFNIYALKKQCRVLKTWDDRAVIRKHALGKFRDLLFASATSPAMLVFLDNLSNVKGVPQENYARELMELHTLGIDGGFTQADVENVARAFTGWSMVSPARTITQMDYEAAGAFLFRANQHDTAPKQVMDLLLPAGGGMSDGEKVLELLATHPKTAEHISFKLVRKFVDDTPPPALVARAAQTFTQTDGDIRAVLSTILHSAEFGASFGKKVKRPNEYIASSLRALEAMATNVDLKKAPLKGYSKRAGKEKRGDEPLAKMLRTLGHVPFLWAAPNGYPDVAAAWVNSNNLLNRWNFALALTTNRIAEFDVAVAEASTRESPEELVKVWSERILQRALPPKDQGKLVEYVRADTSQERAENLVALLLASPHFQYR